MSYTRGNSHANSFGGSGAYGVYRDATTAQSRLKSANRSLGFAGMPDPSSNPYRGHDPRGTSGYVRDGRMAPQTFSRPSYAKRQTAHP